MRAFSFLCAVFLYSEYDLAGSCCLFECTVVCSVQQMCLCVFMWDIQQYYAHACDIGVLREK